MIELPHIQDGEDKSSVLVNRIRKNYRHVRKFAKRTLTNCFRIYDKEIHEYPIAIDFYAGRYLVHYFAKGDNPEPSDTLIQEVEEALFTIFEADKESIFWKTRSKTKETRQYEKISSSKDFFTVLEYGVKFKVNLVDYLDTGLFLDHRETRQRVAALAKDKSVLNLFAYTCSFSVHASFKGAKFTKNVDMSNTYADWGKDNFILNGLPLEQNEVVREDCLKFLKDEVKLQRRYDIIVIDPPTISRSKKMDQLFDVQQDYIFLIECALKLLEPDGIIFFSTNLRNFKFDENLFPHATDITAKTLPIDFHDPKIHRCWSIK